MSEKGVIDKGITSVPTPESGSGHGDEKKEPVAVSHDLPTDGTVEAEFDVTEGDLAEAKVLAEQMSLEDVREFITNVLNMHENDPNFPHKTLLKVREFLGNSTILEHPEKHEDLIYEMKVEAALIANNSPYAEVRAVVSNKDDPSLPVSTVRAWVIGVGFSILVAFVNQLFSIRQPSIYVESNVVQLLSFPVGKLWEKTVPDWGFHLPVFLVGRRLASQRHSLNPGPFNKKEHMLITIMANVAVNTPYTDYIIWTQYLPTYFGQSYAGQFSYQILVGLSTNFIGYGLAGLCRRFLVYPSYCVWPKSLVTIALNESFHSEDSGPVLGPFRSIWRTSRMRFFLATFVAMFVYFWFPNYIFAALSTFSWITWIDPTNVKLTAVTGSNLGMGLNPFPTFDWNILSYQVDPLRVPFFTTINVFLGLALGTVVALGIWFTNAYNTAYLPINSNRLFDNTGARYNVSRIVDHRKIFRLEGYESYSPAYMTAGNLTAYIFFFAIYPATLVYIWLNHKHEFMTGMRNVAKDIKRIGRNIRNRLTGKKSTAAEGADQDQDIHADNTYQDVHNRLMAQYSEVSEWWYLLVLLVAVVLGIVGITNWQTYTTPGVVFYGIILCLIFVVPTGIVVAMTGAEVTLNVLAEFIGGAWSGGNALAMNYFKAYGYVTCAHALKFSNDLKMAHYLKLPPWHTFMAQLVATFVSTFVCTGVLNFQINKIHNVCTDSAPNRFYCPGPNTFFTAAVLWGTIGPRRVFGPGGIYTTMLVGFPIGAAVPVFFWWIQRWARRRSTSIGPNGETIHRHSVLLQWVRQMHPIAFLYGALNLAPYNMTYVWPAVPIAWASWLYIKPRFLGFWSRYNFVLSASFSSAVALCGVIIFFAVQYQDVEINWWGNNVVSMGCEASACPLKVLKRGTHFGPGPGEFV